MERKLKGILSQQLHSVDEVCVVDSLVSVCGDSPAQEQLTAQNVFGFYGDEGGVVFLEPACDGEWHITQCEYP